MDSFALLTVIAIIILVAGIGAGVILYFQMRK
jgi:hypothetical protein